jgi:hypothetical protein
MANPAASLTPAHAQAKAAAQGSPKRHARLIAAHVHAHAGGHATA